MKYSSLVLAAALALAASGPAHADTAVFRYNDLDLASPAGKATFEARIDATLRRACIETATTGTRIPNNRARRECIAQARKQIVEQLAAQGIAPKLAG